MQKIHQPLMLALHRALQPIFNDRKQADKVIELTLKANKKWGARDRAFIAENTYEIVRWFRLLKFCTELPKVHTEQQWWDIVVAWLLIKGYSPSVLAGYSSISAENVRRKFEEAQTIRKVRESIPDWLDRLGEEELGDAWDAELKAMNQPADVFIRVNTLLTSLPQLQKLLADEGIETEQVAGVIDALRLKKRSNIFRTSAFQNGLFEVQDAGSQLISEFLDVQPGMRVIDACAGAGGKSLHIATQMKNKGKVISMDIEEWKLMELKKRAKRQQISSIETRLIEPKTIKRLQNSADRLLLDVPCSGLGVLRRNPDTKWKMNEAFIEEIKETQAEILQQYVSMLKPDGQLVYATCSILPSESELQVQKFLEKNTDFQLIEEQRTSPAKDGFDGFYMAKL
ncbi:MAG: RsmB/NOP family class I SAM-dependent RNA methyltransferase, partial [Spirosomataceae bacterium]